MIPPSLLAGLVLAVLTAPLWRLVVALVVAVVLVALPWLLGLRP